MLFAVSKIWKSCLEGIICIRSSIYENYQLIKSITENISIRVPPQATWTISYIYLDVYIEVQNRHHCFWEHSNEQSSKLSPESAPQMVQFTWKLIFCWVLLLLETLLFSRTAFKNIHIPVCHGW